MALKQWIAALAGCAICSFSGLAMGMTVEVQGNKLFATGPVEDDLRKFEDAFSKGGVDTVVLVNSPGGDLWTGLRIGRMIANQGYKTVIAGFCNSACSIMFMGGKERRFSDAFRPNQTYIGIHGAHNKDTKQINSQVQPQIFSFYKQNMGENFNSAVMNQALYEMDDAGALLRVFDVERSAKTVPYHCRSFQTAREKCTKITGFDALNLGVVTHADLVKLDLPAAFKISNSVLGNELTRVVPDLAGYLVDLASRQCSTDDCKAATQKYIEYPENRAIAVPLQGLGRGISWNADSPVRALVRSVYTCNHPASQPARLCEPEVVNGYEVQQFYRASDVAHTGALGKLAAPKDKFYGNEEYGGGLTSATGMRTEKFVDITPQKLDGIVTLGTQDIARALLSPTPPVVLEVSGATNELIPGSQMLLYGGLAFEDVAKEAAFQKRFDALLRLLAPDLAQPVVFYCAGRDCWLSANAAMRAKKTGYSAVQWYRGGFESWKAAGLPLAPTALRAVVN